MLHEAEQQRGGSLQSPPRRRYLPPGFPVDLKSQLRTCLRVPALQVLPNHYERHQKYLNDIADQQISNKGGKRIESLPVQGRNFGGQDVVAGPQHCPTSDDQKEANRTNFVGYRYGKAVESVEALFVNQVGVPSHSLRDEQVGLSQALASSADHFKRGLRMFKQE